MFSFCFLVNMYIEQIIFYNHIIFYTKGRNNKRDLSSIDEINKKKRRRNMCKKWVIKQENKMFDITNAFCQNQTGKHIKKQPESIN